MIKIIPTRRQIGGYQEFSSNKSILPVEALWTHKTPSDVISGGTHLLVPEPTINIVYTRYKNGHGSYTCEKFKLFGPVKTPVIFPFEPGYEMVAARINPEWLLPTFGVHPDEFVDSGADLKDILPQLNDKLTKAFEKRPDATEALGLLYETLFPTAHESQQEERKNNKAIHAINLIRRTGGRLNLKTLANHLGLSDRHLYRKIVSQIGITPKQFARQIRFLETLKSADYITNPNWSSLAAHHGFFDQAHMINEFNTLSGLTPQQLLNKRNQESVFYNPA